jgi:hypothetical protein
MAKPHDSFKNFLAELNIPPAERDAVAECAARALDAAQRDASGRPNAPMTVADLLHRPHWLGYLAMAVVRDPALSTEAKITLAQHTLERASPLDDAGTPHGLTVLLSALAAVEALDTPTFTRAIKLAEIERALFDAITLDELKVLSDWLIVQPALDDRQRLWWLWYLVGHCEDERLGRPWMEALLGHAALTPDFKRRLCAAWLSPRPPGPVPPGWRALDEALTAELRGAAKDDVEPTIDDEDDFAALDVAGHLMRAALGGYVLIPPYVQQRAAQQAGEGDEQG